MVALFGLLLLLAREISGVQQRYLVTAVRTGGPFFADQQDEFFQFNYNPSYVPLAGGGHALAVRAQCGGHARCNTWLRSNDNTTGTADVSVVAISRMHTSHLNGSASAFEPIVSEHQVICLSVSMSLCRSVALSLCLSASLSRRLAHQMILILFLSLCLAYHQVILRPDPSTYTPYKCTQHTLHTH